MKPTNLPCRSTLAVGLISFSCSVFALDTATIVGSSLSPQCLEYKVVGVCYWLMCTSFGCKVKTSAKVKHFIPELVVSSYTNTGQNPWIEVAGFSAPNASAQGGGNDHSSRKYSSERFKNTDAIGHPGGYVFSQFASGSGYACRSGATAYMPYFLSTLDSLAWRHSTPESFYPEALSPGLREIGYAPENWGHLYPRSGWVNQSNDFKAAAVTTQRAGDLVTRAGQAHVYQPLMIAPQPGYWPPLPVIEGNALNHRWQSLWPIPAPTCAVFPTESAESAISNPLSPSGDYAWALWRPYSCCERKGQTFLGYTDFAQ
jgi:integrating conjugative element protein (TIGR03756 family)